MSSGPDGCLPTASWCGLTKASRILREAFVRASLGLCRSDGAPPTRSEQAAGTSPRGGLEGPQPLRQQQEHLACIRREPSCRRRSQKPSAGLQSYPGAMKSIEDAPGAGRFPLCGKLSLPPRAVGSEATSERLQNSKKWPAGHFFDTLVRAALPPLCREGRSRPGASAEWTPEPGALRRRESPRIPRPPCPRPWQSAVPAARS